ncbi:MAG TPA: hypothetical protein DCL77_09070 [Prolixibacteraceae bacterium]|jgi:hypothetical protein|nr:hypothetical protein [Prolixibacteraceae bacterium]
MASRIIEIRRKGNTSRLPDEVYDESKQNIGSTMTLSGDTRTGLTRDEERKYMPEILGMSSSDLNFPREVKEWFKSLTVNVLKKGVKLEIGTDMEGHPLNVMQFIQYKYAISHPDVGEMDENGVMSRRTPRFHIYDKTSTLEKAATLTTSRKEALTQYIQLTGDPKRADMVLRVLGYNPETLNELEKEPLLEKAAQENTAEFMRIVKDKSLETVAFIQECLTKAILRKEGNTIFDTDEAIGATMEEAVAYLMDKKHSDVIIKLQARLKGVK